MGRLQRTRPVVAVALLGVAPSPSVAQAEAGPLDGYAFEVRSDERILFARQQRAFVPARQDRDRYYVSADSVGPDGLRHLTFAFGFPTVRDGASVTLGPEGRVLAGATIREPREPYWSRSAIDSIESTHFHFFRDRQLAAVSLPQGQLWGLVHIVRTESPTPGTSWTDTLDLSTSEGGFSESWFAVRRTTVLGDTVVDGRRLWRLREESRVTVRERALLEERTMQDFAAHAWTLSGEHRGTLLYDPALRMPSLRHDTTTLDGERTVTLPDGRSFSTPVSVERTREVTLRDADAMAQHVQALREEERRRRIGMLILPDDSLQHRLRRGDAIAVDSLFAVVEDSASAPAERDHALTMLAGWHVPDRDARRRYRDLRLVIGDTTAYLRELQREASGWLRAVTVDDLEWMLPMMEDPGRAHAFGLREEPFYENLAAGLLSRPPAVEEDTASWPCTPAACAMLVRQRTEGTEPRLRDLGVVAAFAMDPVRWVDSVRSRAPEAPLLRGAVELADGVGANWPAGSRAPLPAPEASWRDWSYWMAGSHPDYPRAQPSLLRFSGDHVNAVRVAELLTRRDVVDELRTALDRVAPGGVAGPADPAADSAVATFAFILLGLGEPSDVERMESWLRSDSEVLRSLGQSEIAKLFRDPDVAQPADSVTATELVGGLLEIMVLGADGWPPLHEPTRERRARSSGERPDEPPYLITDGLPAAVATAWADRVTLIDRAAWSERSSREAAILFAVDPVLVAGPFAMVSGDFQTRYARAPDESPGGYAGGSTFFLLRTPEGWRVVATGGWIT